MKPLKKLEDHNKEVVKFYALSMSAQPNGIECPKCGEELCDTDPNVVLTSFPPQTRVGCPACGYAGTRFI